jgi:hypothetical protein
VRAEQVETLLKNQDPMSDALRKGSDEPGTTQFSVPSRGNNVQPPSDTLNMSNIDPQLLPGANESFLGLGTLGPETIKPTGEEFSWEMIGLGLEEPLPLQETINDL